VVTISSAELAELLIIDYYAVTIQQSIYACCYQIRAQRKDRLRCRCFPSLVSVGLFSTDRATRTAS